MIVVLLGLKKMSHSQLLLQIFPGLTLILWKQMETGSTFFRGGGVSQHPAWKSLQSLYCDGLARVSKSKYKDTVLPLKNVL